MNGHCNALLETLCNALEVRQNRLGDLLILFGINPRTCQQCPIKSQCLADGSKGTGGRRITVIRKKLSSSPHEPSAVAQSQPPPMTCLTAQPTGAVLWLDFPTTRLRRELSHQLRQQQIVIESIAANTPITKPKPQSITRDQRAHRRLTWVERWNKNATTDTVAHWQVQLFGISSAVLNWLASLKPRPVLIT